MSSCSRDTVRNSISQHGIIGDLRTLALVAEDGCIDFFCHPNIDSPTLFAGLLDGENGGEFRLSVGGDERRGQQIYLPDTNVLLTRFLGDDGIAEIMDFMPLDGSGRIVRLVQAIRGEATVSLRVAPRPDYGRCEPTIAIIENGARVSWGAGETAFLRTVMPLRIGEREVTGELSLREGETTFVVFCPGRENQPPADAGYVRRAFVETLDFWHKWVSAGRYPVFSRDLVVRSALTLKLLTSAEHGSIAAAATFGLPEVVGGERNWDYRFCWVRDAAFTVYAFSRLNYYDEAEAFGHFLTERIIESSPDGESGLQIMYAMNGGEDLPEATLDHIRGYRDSRPVRVGNAAYGQRQMDIYGELMDAVYISTKARGKPGYGVWAKLARILDWLSDNWQRPDRGIWESRNGDQEYLSSRLMCWVALDRGVRIVAKESLPADVERWRRERDTIQKSIIEEFWNEEIGAFTQVRGGSTLDAVVLLMPLVKFINPRDPLWVSTLKAVKRHLVRDCLVKRYHNVAESRDGLEGEEGAFTICSFWYVEALARTGYVAEARLLFEKLHAYANHLGLYAEELSWAGEHLGNFPQGLTHLSLISAAIWLDRALNGDKRDPNHHEFKMLEEPRDFL